jgi:hypothetical protein
MVASPMQALVNAPWRCAWWGVNWDQYGIGVRQTKSHFQKQTKKIKQLLTQSSAKCMGLPTHPSKKAVFSVIDNTFFRISLFRWADFCPLGGFFKAFLEAPRWAEKHVLIFSCPR